LADSNDREDYAAEAWVADAARLAAYLRPDELHTAFDFDFVSRLVGRDQLRTTLHRPRATRRSGHRSCG